MSDLTITSAGVSVAANSAGSSISTGRCKIVRVTPVISATAYNAGDVLFAATEMPNAVKEDGGCSKLIGISMLSLHDAAVEDVGLVFMENSTNLGTINAATSLADNDALAANIISGCILNGSDNTQDLGACGLYSTIAYTGNSAVSTFSPMLLQAAQGSTSVYVAGIASDAQDYVGTSDIVLMFHIEY
tara:strand:+ start:659 stop:1222 length:564 start_codon:yes stop_codon:yes gene_type:complete